MGRLPALPVWVLAGGCVLGAGCGAGHTGPGGQAAPGRSEAPRLEGAPALADPATWAAWKDADYLILVPRSFAGAIEPLAAHRRSLGHRVATLIAEDLYARFSGGRPEAAALEAGVRALAAHAGGRLRFVLLAGDVDGPPGGNETRAGAPLLPTFYADKVPYAGDAREPWPDFVWHPDQARYATDRPLALAGSDSGDAGGGGREIAVGRIPARSTWALSAFVGKLIEYEREPVRGEWPRMVRLFAAPGDFGPLADRLAESTATRLIDRGVSYDFDVQLVFAKAGSAYAYPPDRLRDKVVADLDAGALVAAYVGHGAWNAFDSVQFRNRWYGLGTASDAASLRIPAGKPLFFAFTCDTGAFDLPDGRLSLAERMVMNPDGPIAVFASSRESHPYPNALYAAAVVETFTRQRAATIGEGLIEVRRGMQRGSIALAEMLVRQDIDELKTEHEGLFNLLGDPATRLRYPQPLEVRSTAGEVHAPGSSAAVEVRAPFAEGRVLVTLETHRNVVRGALVPAADLERLSAPQASSLMAQNHAMASNKVLSRAEETLRQGRATVSVALPREPGSYVVKAWASSSSAVAAGHTELTVTVPSASPSPAATSKR
ncbi:MAG: C25 family cysteine peptidase [Polyangiaceae bacterium]